MIIFITKYFSDFLPEKGKKEEKYSSQFTNSTGDVFH